MHGIRNVAERVDHGERSPPAITVQGGDDRGYAPVQNRGGDVGQVIIKKVGLIERDEGGAVVDQVEELACEGDWDRRAGPAVGNRVAVETFGWVTTVGRSSPAGQNTMARTTTAITAVMPHQLMLHVLPTYFVISWFRKT